MRITGNSVDLKFSDDMDFIINSNVGDLKLAKEFNGEVTTQMVIRRVFSDLGDWKIFPSTGANLNQFQGIEFNREISNLIKTTIIDELSRDFLINSRNIQVKVIPLTSRNLSIIVMVQNSYMKKPVVVSTGLSLDNHITSLDSKTHIK